ncbi:MAG TPA: UBP-type zinc finger domain-containing protein [Streptosporangiaceae bacterium]|nr:UBP-type zinc finger domain-containing protein [Streptosporangiaceae bacterium]
MAHRAHWNTADGSATRCEHLDAALLDYPRSKTCGQCAADGMTWLALRLCLTCGWVACSDESPGQHAKAHYEETDHAVAAAAEPGSTWRWCYVHERAV